MPLSREAVVEHLQKILSPEQVVTDPNVLQQRSIDNFRKLQSIFNVFTMEVPAAVAMVRTTAEAAAVLAFADEHGVNVVARTGGTATEGGLETPVPNSIVLDGGLMNEIIKIDPYNMQATAQKREHRADVDDLPAALRHHELGGFVAHLERRREVDVDRGVPLRPAEVEHLGQRADARRVDQDVDRPQLVDAGLDDPCRCASLGDVGGNEAVASSLGLDQRTGHAVVVGDAGHEDIGTALGQRQRECLPEPGVATGDDGVLAGQAEVVHGKVCNGHVMCAFCEYWCGRAS